VTKLRDGYAVLTIEEMIEAARQAGEFQGWDSGETEWALRWHLLEPEDVSRLLALAGEEEGTEPADPAEVERLTALYMSHEDKSEDDAERLTDLLQSGLTNYQHPEFRETPADR
jgi:hypothetical protein